MVKKIKPSKEGNLLEKIKKALDSGNYLESKHAVERALERNIIATEYEYVLKTGWHESKKDTFDFLYNTWNYSVRGKTIDKRELRVIISFDENDLLIITVIDLEEK